MIANELQYRVTKAAATRFRAALSEMKNAPPSAGVHPRLLKAEREAMESQLLDLEAELATYDQLKKNPRSPIRIESLGGLGEGLVKARIAAGLSQKELAQRLEMKEQQIQRYEKTGYAHASLSRLTTVAEALHVLIDRLVIRTTDKAEPR